MKFPRNVTLTMEAQVQLTQLDQGECIVYLLHFEWLFLRPANGTVAGHYVGMTNDIYRRMRQHKNGEVSNGSPLVRLAIQRGQVTIMKVWKQDGHFEQRIKRNKKHWTFCPSCRQDRGRCVQAKYRRTNVISINYGTCPK